MSEVVQVALCKKCNASRPLSEFSERKPGIRRKLCSRHDKKALQRLQMKMMRSTTGRDWWIFCGPGITVYVSTPPHTGRGLRAKADQCLTYLEARPAFIYQLSCSLRLLADWDGVHIGVGREWQENILYIRESKPLDMENWGIPFLPQKPQEHWWWREYSLGVILLLSGLGPIDKFTFCHTRRCAHTWTRLDKEIPVSEQVKNGYLS